MKRAIRHLLFLFLLLGVFSSVIKAQNCTPGGPSAIAGLPSLGQPATCPFDTFLVSISGQNQAQGFTTLLLVTDEAGKIIKIDSSAHKIGGLAPGNYRIYSYNYLKSNPPSTKPAIGVTLGAVSASAIGCFDISTALSVTIQDVIKPQIICKQTITNIYLDTLGVVKLSLTLLGVKANDNCRVDTVLFEPQKFTCTQIGQHNVRIIAIDAVGLRDTCTSIVVVQDTTKPKVKCRPATIYLAADGTANLTPAKIDNGSTDNCGIAQLGLSQTKFTCNDLGRGQITLIAYDASENSSTCSTVLTVLDTIKPLIKCQNATIYLSANGIAQLSKADVDANSSDNCGIEQLTLSRTTFTCADLGTKTVTLIGKDLSGNIDSCQAQVMVKDTTKPQALCQPATIYLDTDGKASVTANKINASSTDNCGSVTLSLSNVNFICNQVGGNTVTLTVKDGSGNEKTCQTTVTVRDTTKPKAICKPLTVYLNGAGSAGITAAQIDLSTDNCLLSKKGSLSMSTFTCVNLGQNPVLLTVRDTSGNQNSCTSIITVLDTIKPLAKCRNVTLFLNAQGVATLSPAQVNNGSTDNCLSSLQLSLDRTQWTCDDQGFKQVTLTTTDASNNKSTCVAQVMVFDTTAPQVVCKNLTLYLDANGKATADPNQADGGSSDNCGLLRNKSLSKTQFTCADKGKNTVLFTTEDASSNFRSCQLTITVLDTLKPVAQCKTTKVYLNANGVATVSADSVNNGSYDNCGKIKSIELSATQYTCANVGPNSVTLTVRDSSGNTSTCAGTVMVLDTLRPQVTCKNLTVYLSKDGVADISVGDVENDSRDNCGSITDRQLSRTRFSCADLGVQSVTLTVTDRYGNKNSCTAQVTVKDTVRPVVRCGPSTIFLGTDGLAVLTPDQINRGTTDNCMKLTYRLSKSIFTCSDRGKNAIKLYAIDGSGNIDSCQTILTVIDQVRPDAVCKNITLYLDAKGEVSLLPKQIDGGSKDNCIIDSMTINKTRFSCANVGENVVLLTVYDQERNSHTCASGVTVLDTIRPIMQCPENLIVNAGDDGDQNCFFTVTNRRLDPSGRGDNCSIKKVAHNFKGAPSDTTLRGANFPVGTTLVTWTIEDASGLKRSCSVSVQVRDNILPVFKVRDTVLVQLGTDGNVTIDSSTVDLGSSDNCSLATFKLDRKQFSCKDVGYRTIEATLKDAAGNTVTRKIVVVVLASAACPLPKISNEKGPNISDPCSCKGNGAFFEEIVIGPSLSNQVWKIKTTTLRDTVNQKYYPVGTQFREIKIKADSSIYVLKGVHLDGEGYTLEALSPMFPNTLTIANRCSYPKPVITGLDDPICLFSPNIVLGGNAGAGVQGLGTFTIDGKPATTFNPKTLGKGIHQVGYTFDAGNPAGKLLPKNIGCTSSVTKAVEVLQAPGSFSCYNDITITSNSACEVLIVPDYLLSNKFPCYDDYQVILSYNGVQIPNPAPPQYVGQNIVGIIVYKPDPNLATCRTNIKLIDLSGPQFKSCPADITTQLVCSDYDLVFNKAETIDPKSKYFTGRPVVEDNCSGSTLTFNDAPITIPACDPKYTRGILRTFLAKDKFGNTSSCVQKIYFGKPKNIFFPKDTLVKISCTAVAPKVDAKGNIDPSVSGQPYIFNGFGEKIVLPADVLCSYSMTYSDTRFSVCGSRYGLFRTWSVLDRCNQSQIIQKQQYIEVGDFDAPVVSCPLLDLDKNGLPDDVPVYSTAPSACSASVPLPTPQIKDCSATTLRTDIYSWGTGKDIYGFPTGKREFARVDFTVINGVAQNVPPGDYYFVFTVTDLCNNITKDTCLFRVLDRITPTMICNSELNMSLGGGGIGIVRVTDVDKNSRDNCDNTNLKLDIRRLIPAECSATGKTVYSDWGQTVEFACCDIGKLGTVELRGTDLAGNVNTCITRFNVEDKLPPSCNPPVNVTINCNGLPPGFSATNLKVLQQSFGVPTVDDNCSATWEELPPNVQLSNCGVGTITRKFRAKDTAGNFSSSICEQLITVKAVHNYEIKFPKDVVSFCGTPIGDTLQIKTIGCDVLAVNVENREFVVPGGGCYQILRTFRVINWCEYDNSSDPIILSRDADCDQQPGDEALYVLQRPNGVTYLDRDNNETNAIPAAGQKSPICDNATNPAGFWTNSVLNPSLRSRGFWQYTQTITVVDTVKPVVQSTSPAIFCSDNSTTCNGLVNVTFKVFENCTPKNLTISVGVDLNGNGTIDRQLAATDILGTYPNYQIQGTFPIGSHAYRIEVRDACGNLAVQTIAFKVIDCKGPAPTCINGLSTTLRALTPPVDANGDGKIDLAAVTLKATDFVSSPAIDCSGPVRYSINKQGKTPDINQTQLVFTCGDEGVTLVEIYAWDQANNPTRVQPNGTVGGPNFDFCGTFVDIQNNSNICVPVSIPRGQVKGNITSEDGRALGQVQVTLSDQVPQQVMTSSTGEYSFNNLVEGRDYTVTPRLEGDDINGVTTFDLIIIRRHILGIQVFDSPYKMIAGDVNNSRTISTLDMVLLQKLILGIDIKLTLNSSWRFVDAAYKFKDPTNPWKEGFPEVVNINNLVGQKINASFIAVKIGDVNGSATLPGLAPPVVQRQSSNRLLIDVEDQALQAGQTYTIALKIKDMSAIQGYQFGLQYNAQQLELLDVKHGLAKTEQIAVFADEGLISTNWFTEKQIPAGDTSLFYLVFRAKANVQLREVLQLSSRRLRAEAYNFSDQRMELGLRFNEQNIQIPGFELFQNVPNPFQEETLIRFYLPEATKGSLVIYDAAGRVLQTYSAEYVAGMNSISVRQQNGNGLPSGVLYYAFRSNRFMGTKKMIRLE